jgi:predicted nucleic acid-binding protein
VGAGLKFVDIPAGQAVLLDANVLVDHFSANPITGTACQALLKRIVNQEIQALTSAHVMAEMSHRLMTIEACATFGWPYKGIAQRLANHPLEIQQLTQYRQAIDEVVLFGIQVLPVLPHHVSLAANAIRQHGLLFNDSLLVAIVQDHGLTNLASHDADFDRVPSITRFAPV